MTALNELSQTKLDELAGLEILVVEIMGIKIGIDAGHIHKIIDPEDEEHEPEDVVKLHDAISFRTGEIEYKRPRIIFTKEKAGRVCYMVDQLQEIISVDLEDIQPLPPLVEASRLSSAVWGATLVDGEIIILLDLEKLKVAN